jgi:prolyl oligopeptidase PreP (S9A serine peptidase family)
VSRTYDNLTFHDDKETIISFQVPPNLSSITLTMEGGVMNNTTHSMDNWTSPERTFLIQNHRSSHRICEMYLRKVGQDYFVHVLGRNGEAQKNNGVITTCYHKDHQATAKQTSLITDQDGKIGIGPLKDITRVTAKCRNSNLDVEETWTIINQAKDSWTQSTDIHIIKGEDIEIPVNYDQSKPKLRSEVTLAHYLDGKLISNLFERVELESAGGGHYSLLKLAKLDVGEYRLQTKFCANEFQKITITVHQG